MYFDAKTRKFYGKIRDITPEERAFLDDQVAKGIRISSKHPPQEEIDASMKWQSEHEFNEGLEDLLRERGIQV